MLLSVRHRRQMTCGFQANVRYKASYSTQHFFSPNAQISLDPVLSLCGGSSPAASQVQ